MPWQLWFPYRSEALREKSRRWVVYQFEKGHVIVLYAYDKVISWIPNSASVYSLASFSQESVP